MSEQDIAAILVENFEPLEALAVAIMVLRRLAQRAGVEPAALFRAALAAEGVERAAAKGGPR